MTRSIWHCDPADLLELEAEARGVTRERLVRDTAERYRRALREAGVVGEDGMPREAGE